MRLRNIPRADAVLDASPFVIKDPAQNRGRWAENTFRNDCPLYIEIGMGKGQFLLTHAAQNPAINYIGIERYSSVLLRAVEKLNKCAAPDSDSGQSFFVPDEYNNLRFICCDAAALPEIFGPGEVSRIYLNFSDPWPKARHSRRRLTSKEFFSRYEQILSPEGQIEFKTDNRPLFDFSVEQINTSDTWKISACTYDLHNDARMNPENILTEYEAKFSSRGNPIFKFIARRKTKQDICI